MTGNLACRQAADGTGTKAGAQGASEAAVWCGFSCIGGGSEWQDELVKQAGSRSRRAL